MVVQGSYAPGYFLRTAAAPSTPFPPTAYHCTFNPKTLQKTKHGWLTYFMNFLNATWPHPKHLAINVGVPGASFRAFSQGLCLVSGSGVQEHGFCLCACMEMRDTWCCVVRACTHNAPSCT